MMISVGQRFTLLAKLGENIDWDSLTTEQVQVGIRESTRAGAGATAFIRNGFQVQTEDFFREMGEIAIYIPALPHPTLQELQKKEPWIRRIERDTSPTEAVTLKLGTVLRADEERINGLEYERRLISVTGSLGYHAEWLVKHQKAFPAFMALLGKICIDLPGLIGVFADGHRGFPCLDIDGERWGLGWGWFERGLGRRGRLAVSGK